MNWTLSLAGASGSTTARRGGGAGAAVAGNSCRQELPGAFVGRRRTHRELALGKLADVRRDVRPGGELGHELLDLLFGLVGRPREDLLAVLLGEVRHELADARKVKPAALEHLEELRKRRDARAAVMRS